MKFRIKRIVKAGQAMPKWFGVGYLIDGNATKVCFRIPVNLIVAAARKIRYRLRYAKQNRWDEDLQAARIAGHREGQKTGFEAGRTSVSGMIRSAYRRGFNDGDKLGFGRGFDEGRKKGRHEAARHVSKN